MEIYAFEVARLYRALDAWLAKADPNALAGVVSALDGRFVMIQPDGALLSRDDTVTALRLVGGTGLPGHRTEIAQLEGRLLPGGHCLVSFLARQQAGDEAAPPQRVSAVLRLDRAAPVGVAWVSLHQTWLAT